jgi:nitrogen fixation protein NifU and related proteins
MDIYREVLMDHAVNPRNTGRLAGDYWSGHEDNPVCGDSVDFFIKVKSSILTGIKHNTVGCAIAVSAASVISEQMMKQKIHKAVDLTVNDVCGWLGTELTTSRRQCANVAIRALQNAVKSVDS